MTMKKTLLLSALAVVLSLTACNKEVTENSTPAPVPSVGQTVHFTSVAPETKAAFTTPSGTHYPVLWTSNDTQMAVTMNYSSTPVTANVTRSADNKTASFNAEFDNSGTAFKFVAVSPASAVKSVATSNKRVNIEVPSGQTPTATSPDEKAMVLYAKSDEFDTFPASVDMDFHHFTGYVHLVFTNYADALADAGATVQSVSITSDKEIAGRVFFFPETGTTEANAMSKTLTVTTSSLDDVWVALAPVDLSNETLSITIGTDKGTISKDVGFSSGCNLTSGKIAKVTVDLNGIDVVAPVRYNLVTATNQLHIGDKIIIVAANFNCALSTTQNANNRGETSVSKGDGFILDPSDAVEVIQLEDGVKPGEYALKAAAGYLYAANGVGGGAGNYLRTAAPPVPAASAPHGSWTITILPDGKANGSKEPDPSGTTDNVAQVYAEANARGQIRYNSTNNLFSAYELNHASTNHIHLYRLNVDPDTSPRFKATMPDADGENNVSVPAAGSDLDVYVFGNSAWTASVTGGATLSASSGTGNTILTLTVPENASTTDTRAYTLTVSTSAGVVPSSYTFNLTQAKAASAGSVKVGDTLLAEWWEGATANQAPSAYCVSASKTTTVYGGGAVTYTEYSNGATTSLKSDGLVFYQKSANIAIEQYRYNLLISKNNGYLNISGIPCSGVKTATFKYRSNYNMSKQVVLTSTENVTVGSLSQTSVTKLDDSSKNTYTISCTVTIPDGTDTVSLQIKNTDASNNMRVDGIELLVTEIW